MPSYVCNGTLSRGCRYIVLVGDFETIDSCCSNKSLVFFCQLVYNIVAFSWLFPTLEGVKLLLCYLLYMIGFAYVPEDVSVTIICEGC